MYQFKYAYQVGWVWGDIYDLSLIHIQMCIRDRVGAARLMSKKASTDYSFITKQAFINNYEHSMERIKNGLEEAWKNKRLTDFIQCTDKIKELLTALNMDLFENDKIINRLYTCLLYTSRCV